MKTGVIGAGKVGSACVLSLVLRGSAREIVVVNRNRQRADGVVSDIQYGAVLSPTVDIRAGDYADLAGASLVMITAGVNEKTGGATDAQTPLGDCDYCRRMLRCTRRLCRRCTAPLRTR